MSRSDQSSYPSQIRALPARRVVAQSRSAAILCPARPKVGGPGTFCGCSVPRTPKGWWSRHVQRPLCVPPALRMAAWARSAAILCPARPEDGVPGTFCGHYVPRPPGGWRPRHVLRRFCALPAQRLVVQARSAAIMCPARPEEGGSGTFCSGYVPCAPEGGRSWHVLRLFCAPDAKRMAVLARSADILCPGRFRPLSAGRKKGAGVLPRHFCRKWSGVLPRHFCRKWSGVLPRHSCRKVVGSAAASFLQKSGRECCRVTPAQFQGRDVSVWVG